MGKDNPQKPTPGRHRYYSIGWIFWQRFKAGNKMFQQVKSNTLETNGKLENHSKEIKCRQMETLELKNVITKIENTLHRLNSRMESQWTWKTEQPKLPNINNREKNTEKEKNH